MIEILNESPFITDDDGGNNNDNGEGVSHMQKEIDALYKMPSTWLGGEDVHLLGLIKIPPLIEENFFLYPQALAIHYYSALILTALFSLHIAAALYHRFMINDKYGVWKRMSFSRHKV